MEQDNEPGRYTHQHHPDYLLDETVELLSISAFTSRHLMPGKPVYYYRGLRCYSRFRKEAEPRPERYLLPGCEKMMKDYELETITERTVPNRGDIALLYYSAEKEFQIGLYRVLRRR